MKNTPKGKTPILPSKPVSHYKTYKTPSSSSSSSIIPKKPVPKQKGPSAASETNTNPSFTEGVWELAVGAGKLAFFVGKTAAIVTAGVVKGIEIAHNQNNEKPKETFSCFYTDLIKEIDYQGTLYLTDNQIVFSANRVLPTRSFFKEKPPLNPKLEFKIPFQEVFEINKVNAENPLTRSIQIRGVKGSYCFRGVHDFDKAYNHMSMGIKKPNKPISQLRPNRIN